jgi:CarD family transcriptional regulator
MMFSVGDKVVHPGYGPGVIEEIERRQVMGDAKQYYVIAIQNGGGTLMTPVSGAKAVGLRSAISKASVARLLRSLALPPRHLSGDYRERQSAVEDRLKEANVFTTAEVVRDLAWHGQAHHLTKRDAQLKERAEEIVAGEVALVQEVEFRTALDHVQAILSEAMRSGQES